MSQPATLSQIDYATKLCKELGYDPDDYNFEKMNKVDISVLIAELKSEVE